MSLLNDALRKNNAGRKKKEPLDAPELKINGASKIKTWLKLSACGGVAFFLALFICRQVFFCSDSDGMEQKPGNFFYAAKYTPEKVEPVLTCEIASRKKSCFSSAPEKKESQAEKVISEPEVIAKIDLPVKKKDTSNNFLAKKNFFTKKNKETSKKLLKKKKFSSKKKKQKENCEKKVGSEEIFYKKALTYQKANRFNQAIRMYREVLKNNPERRDALLNIGACYIKISEFSNAIIYLDKLKTLETGSCDGLINLAVAQIKLGRFNKALVCLGEAEALTKIPRFEIFLYRGLAFSRLNESDQALKWYRKAEQLVPKNSLLLFNMAILFDKQKIYPEAVKYYSACLGGADLLSDEEQKAVKKRVSLIKRFMKPREYAGLKITGNKKAK